jgi:hypothetical protein
MYDEHDVIQAIVLAKDFDGYHARARRSNGTGVDDGDFDAIEEAKAWCLAIARMG